MNKNTILLASNNKGKINEIKEIFQEYDVLSLSDIEDLLNKKIVVTEEQNTFSLNALEKATCLFDQTGSKYICIADDSGISIDYLDGFPGVYTARWMNGSDHDKNLALLGKLDGVDRENRTCHYTTVIAVKSPTVEKVFENVLDGVVSFECKGANGFGFDEIFETFDGSTLAELSLEKKIKISPRRKSLYDLQQFMNNKNQSH